MLVNKITIPNYMGVEDLEISIFKAAAEASGLQFVAARVVDRELGVVNG